MTSIDDEMMKAVACCPKPITPVQPQLDVPDLAGQVLLLDRTKKPIGYFAMANSIAPPVASPLTWLPAPVGDLSVPGTGCDGSPGRDTSLDANPG